MRFRLANCTFVAAIRSLDPHFALALGAPLLPLVGDNRRAGDLVGRPNRRLAYARQLDVYIRDCDCLAQGAARVRHVDVGHVGVDRWLDCALVPLPCRLLLGKRASERTADFETRAQ